MGAGDVVERGDGVMRTPAGRAPSQPGLSAWESVRSGRVMRPDLRVGVSASDRERPLVTGVNGPLMARSGDSGLAGASDRPLRPELAAPLGVWPSSSLFGVLAGGCQGLLLYLAAVLPPSSAPVLTADSGLASAVGHVAHGQADTAPSGSQGPQGNCRGMGIPKVGIRSYRWMRAALQIRPAA